MPDKAELRRVIRARAPAPEERMRQSNLLCQHVLHDRMYQSATVIGAYVPLAREADVTPLLLDILQSGRILALPLCGTAPHMTLRRVMCLDALVPGPYGLLEPPVTAPIIDPASLDLLLTPLEGIDPIGMRLGKGGGYYDCLLSGLTVPTLGCAGLWQWVERIPTDPWDRPLTACADCRGIHVFPNTQ